MSEIEALLGLYGAIDRAVVAGAVDPARLAPILGAYREDADGGPATGWYDEQYLPWVQQVADRRQRRIELGEEDPAPAPPPPPKRRPDRPGRPDFPLPDRPDRPGRPTSSDDLPEHALAIRDALAAFPAEVVQGRAAARRLLAVTVAARAMPQYFGGDGSHADEARSTLAFTRADVDPGSFAGVQLATRLHIRLENEFTSMDQWEPVVRNAVSEGLLPDTFEVQSAAPPCTGKLILRASANSNDLDPCTVLEAEFTTSKITFDEAKRYLEPENWQFQGSLWSVMKKGKSLGKNTWLYHETVATSSWTVSTNLQFWFSHPTADEARAEYDLGPGPSKKIPDIEIDEGSLRVIDLGADGVRVVTTKRVRFAGSFDGAGLAMFMCASGYSTVLEDMVFSVAEASTTSTKPFPVPAPTGGGAMPDPDPAAKTGQSAKNQSTKQSTEGGEDSLEAISADVAEYVSEYLGTMTKTYSASMKSVQAGTYKVEDAWKDGISMWTSYMTGLGKAVELGTRTAKVYSKKKTDES